MKPASPESAVFAGALQHATPEARAAYLDGACGTDPALRGRVEALLRAAEHAGDFLEHPPTGLGEDADSTLLASEGGEQPGDRIGRYKLLEKIGEGGCGVVYMAEQEEPVRRRVALKVIKLGMDTHSVIARFEAERQALAVMDHPNIAKVFDGGATQAGRPYFVMELVRGVRITGFCDEARLPTEARLRLFVQVCQAIQHAHQKGIIHRDLKPSNILVTVNDGAPVPKVIDFGIAKAIAGERLTDKTLFTHFHSFIGTPAYTSPEQAEMSSVDVDTRSDIYSLGVLLYELLTGGTPFDGGQLVSAGLDEMRRIIRHDEPPKPSTRLTKLAAAGARRLAATPEAGGACSRRPPPAQELIRAVRGDLDWIVMKCLEKDRARRYATANGIAADIQRHLGNEPVNARPPSAGYRFQKWVYRNRTAFTAGMAVAAALVLGLAASVWQYVEKSRAYERTLRAEREQSRLRRTAEADRGNAESAAARSEQVARFLTDMLHGVGPSVARGRDTTLLRDILDKTAGRVEHDLRDQPEVQGDLFFTLGQTYSDLTALARAEEMFTRALEKYRTALPAAPHAKLVLTLARLAVTQVSQGNTAAGKPRAEEALWMARALGDRRILVTALRHQARALDPSQDIPEAVPFLREALVIQKQLGDDPVAEGDILRQLGGCLAWETNPGEAEDCLRAALELHRRHLAANDLAIAQDQFNLAQVLTREHRFAEAEANIREALDIVRPVVDAGHQSLTDFIAFLTHVFILRGKWDEAEVLLQDAVVRSPDGARYRNLLGNLYARQQRWAEAAAEFQREAALPRHANYVPLDPVVAMLKAGQTTGGLELWRIFSARLANTREFDVADKLAKMGLLLPLDPVELARAGALADYASTAQEPTWLVPWMQFVKALADLRRGQFPSAAEWSARCLANPSTIPPCQAGVRFIQAMAFARLHRTDEARSTYQAGKKLMASAGDYTTGNFEGYWVVWAIADLLQHETDAVLKPPAPPARP